MVPAGPSLLIASSTQIPLRNSGRPVPLSVPPGTVTVFAQNLAANARTAFSLSAGTFTIDDLQLADAMCIAAPPSLAAWWTANATTDSQTQPGVAGAAENGVSHADGKVAQAFSFDGVDDRVGARHDAAGRSLRGDSRFLRHAG